MTATTKTAPLIVEYYEPSDLLDNKNSRLDPRMDAAFCASVKEHGVLQPVIALRTPEGKVRIRLGHRRKLAAAAAKIKVPVLVVGDEGDGKAENIARLFTQYDENTHRTGFTVRETAGVVQDLLDLGVTEAQLRKKTGLRKEEITAAKAAVKSPGALEFADTWTSLTLEQAATIAEFDGDEEALAALADASGRGQVDHVAQQLRESAAERAQKKQLIEELAAAGVTLLDGPLWNNRLFYLVTEEGEDLTVENHAGCPGHAAWLTKEAVRSAVDIGSGIGGADAAEAANDALEGEDDDEAEAEMVWRQMWLPVYGCVDPDMYGHKNRYGGRSGGATKPATDEEKEAASAERRKVIAGNKEWRAAETVRRRWLKEFLTRTSPPDGSLKYILRALAGDHYELKNSMERGHQLGAELLGLGAAEKYGTSRRDIGSLLDEASEARAQVIALGLVLAATEESLGPQTWRSAEQYPNSSVASYLNLLVGWGYGLSNIESKIAAAVVEKTS